MIKTARVKFDKLLGTTLKACLIRVSSDEYWIPKSLCKNFVTNNKLSGSVVLPTFLVNKMFNIDINNLEFLPNYIIPELIIETHIPEKFTPVEDNSIQDLKR